MRQTVFREHESQRVPATDIPQIEEAVNRLKKDLRPRLRQLNLQGTTVEFRNLVGSVGLQDGAILVVEPKVGSSRSWTDAVVQLLDHDTRISVTGSRKSDPSRRQNGLSEAIAFEYARRLERALSRQGPIQMYERVHLSSRRLSGHLNVGKWVKSAPLNPVIFPLERDEFSVSNDFSRAFSVVAGQFARMVRNAGLAARLRRLETAMIPGLPTTSYVDKAIANRPFPSQWSEYRSAWDIVVAVIKNHSLVGDPGRSFGLEIAVEPWGLLETLLGRVLKTVAGTPGLEIAVEPKDKQPLLLSGGEPMAGVIPDGVLSRKGSILATFEAKYTRPGDVPNEKHIYQALTTAAALQSPLSVIVYPGSEDTKKFDVIGFNGTPHQLVTVGLEMYSYNRADGDEQRADLIRAILAG